MALLGTVQHNLAKLVSLAALAFKAFHGFCKALQHSSVEFLTKMFFAKCSGHCNMQPDTKPCQAAQSDVVSTLLCTGSFYCAFLHVVILSNIGLEAASPGTLTPSPVVAHSTGEVKLSNHI